MTDYGKNYATSVLAKTQANGAQTLSVNPKYSKWFIQVIPSATPSAGTMAIGVKIPGSSAVTTLTTTIDLTGAERLISFESPAEAIVLTPTSFDADKTYSAYLFAI